MPRTVVPLEIALRLETQGDPSFIAEAERGQAYVRLPRRLTPRDLLGLDPRHDPNELIRHRYLCRGGSLLNVGPTGVGKSALIMQMGVRWALGRDFFGLNPVRPLKSIFLQAENDDMDMAEMISGVLGAMPDLGDLDREAINAGLSFYREDSKTGDAFVQILEGVIHETHPDIAFIDPAFAYIGGNVSDQVVVTTFLRNKLQPLLNKSGVGLVINHHTNKPPTGKEKSGWRNSDFAYLGSGSSEWANWARAVMGLVTTDAPGIYRLILGKRGSRAGWRDAANLPMIERYIAHAKEAGLIYWREATREERDEAGGQHLPTVQDLVNIVKEGAMKKKDLAAAILDIGGKRSYAYKLIKKALADNVLRESSEGMKSTGKLKASISVEDPDEN